MDVGYSCDLKDPKNGDTNLKEEFKLSSGGKRGM
jgi:hypothetical protein